MSLGILADIFIAMSKKDYETFKSNAQMDLVIITCQTTAQSGSGRRLPVSPSLHRASPPEWCQPSWGLFLRVLFALLVQHLAQDWHRAGAQRTTGGGMNDSIRGINSVHPNDFLSKYHKI